MKNDKKLSRSRELGGQLIYAALTALKDNGGQLPTAEVVTEVEKRVQFDDWAKERYEKSGNQRWWAMLHFFSIGCIKAGFLVKKKGVWYLTPEGDDAIKLGAMGLLVAGDEAYRRWREENPKKPEESITEEHVEKEPLFNLDEVEQKAIEGLREYIFSKNAYEFQDLAAALLRGMGYFTPFIAPKGKDGGVDIIAYRDPLGTVSPRVKVQIKHRPESPTGVQEVRQLMGLLQKDGDVGLFVSTGGFSSDAKVTARSSHVHIELIDLERFISLWQDFYPKLSDADKAAMPLYPVYFLAPDD